MILMYIIVSLVNVFIHVAKTIREMFNRGIVW